MKTPHFDKSSRSSSLTVTPLEGKGPSKLQKRPTENTDSSDSFSKSRVHGRPVSDTDTKQTELTSAERDLHPASIKKQAAYMPYFDLDKTDPCFGKSFRDMAKYKFSKKRPYCFATGIDLGHLYRERVITDASNLALPLDFENDPRIVHVRGPVKNLRLSDVQFFCLREGKGLEHMGSFSSLVSSPYNDVLRNFIVQEEQGSDMIHTAVVEISIAVSYFLGIHVGKNQDYAQDIMKSLDSYVKERAMTLILSANASVKEDTRVARALIDFGASPHTINPCDDTSPMDVAKSYNNKTLVQLFESTKTV